VFQRFCFWLRLCRAVLFQGSLVYQRSSVWSVSSVVRSCICFLPCLCSKFRYQGSRVPFSPPSPGFSEEIFAVLLHGGDECARRRRLLVPRRPNMQVQEYRGQVNSFLRQPVIHPSSIGLLDFGGEDPRRLELLQTIGQDVRGNPFPRFLKLLKCPEPPDQQITDDQQRPAISKHLEGDAHRAVGAAFRLKFLRHIRQTIEVTCKMQVIVSGRAGDFLGPSTDLS
jgi:hypothetical protein